MNRGSRTSTTKRNKNVVDNGGFTVAVKRRRGVPKSANKDLYYSKSINGCEDTNLAKAIHKFETKHRRLVNVDDVVNLFHELQVEEPHSNVLVYEDSRSTHNNYYSVLDVSHLYFDNEPLIICERPHYKYVKRHKKVRKVCDYTFDEIIFEHNYILSLQQHHKILDKYHVPHSDVFEDIENEVDDILNSSNIYKDISPMVNQVRESFPNCDKYLDIIEDLIFISYVLIYCEDSNILLGTLLNIYKKHNEGSLTGKVYKFIEHICFNRKRETPHSGDFRSYINKLMTLRHSILFQRICEGLSLCVAFGFIDPINITYRNLKLFSCKACDLGSKSNDIIGYITELLLYFFDTGYTMFTGNFDRIFDVSELSKIDEDILHLKTYIQSIQLGSYTMETDLSVDDYYTRMLTTIDSLKLLISSTKDKTNRTLLNNKLTSLYQLMVLFDQSKPLSGLREAPFSLSFYGQSSVGKSSSSKMLLTNILHFNNKNSSDEHICVIQPTDKFYSTYKANVTGVIIDDLANTTHNKAVVDPASLLISIINNIPFYAPKSESQEKGKINVRPNVVVVTTNKQDFEANVWSNEPISVVRRLKYHIEVKVRPEFSTNNGLDSSKVTDIERHNLKTCGLQDLWLFDVNYVERYYKNNVECWKFTRVVHKSKELTDICIFELAAFLNQKSEEHFKEQAEFVQSCKDSGLRHSNCKVCYFPVNRCICASTDLCGEPQSGYFCALNSVLDNIALTCAKYLLCGWSHLMPNRVEKYFICVAFKVALFNLLDSYYLSFLKLIPFSVRETKYYKNFHIYSNRHKFYNVIIKYLILIFFTFLSCFKYPNICSYLIISLLLIGFMLLRYTYWYIIKDLENTPVCSLIPVMEKSTITRSVFKIGISITVALVVLKTFRAIYNGVKSGETSNTSFLHDDNIEGNLNPTSYQDILDRDKEVNVWNKKSVPLSVNPNTITMTTDQLINKISPNVLSLVFPFDEFSGVNIGCLALKSNIFCCPLHFFKEDKNIFKNWRKSNVPQVDDNSKYLMKLKFIKHDGDNANHFTSIIDVRDIVQVADLDLCVFVSSSGGSFPDITKYFTFLEGECNTRTIKRDRFGVITKGCATVRNMPTSYTLPGMFYLNKVFNIQGGKSIYDNPTSCGDCMMVHVSDGKAPSIVGFHISGLTGTNRGSYTMFKTDQLDESLKSLERNHKIFTPMSGGFIDVSRLGTHLVISEEVPSTAPVSYLKDHNYIVRGSIGDQVSYFSEIKPTFMCKHVEEIFGVVNIWSGPKFGPQRWKPWYTFLSSSSHNDSCMNSSLLRLSMDDYIKPLLDALTIYDKSENMRPLEHHEIINGIPGKRFIDHINFNSSIGYPLKGKKSSHMCGYSGHFDFIDKDIILLEFDKMKNCYLCGDRYYPIFKASLKDEPIEKTKDKVRVFQAADITLQYGWRKYGLPILRFLSLYPLLSECAVGINPYNSEWDELHNHLTDNRTNNDRILAGDYKKWDQKLPAQLVLAAFEIIIRLANRIPNYTDEDVTMIKGLATDTTYYLSHFNGTLIEFNNGLPSGHNLTAHINSIANAILLRYGYYYYRNPAPFRTYCKAITYGDDFECGVSKDIKNFDHLKYKEIVESLGMTLTMPDKSSTAIPFLHVDKCDFLKRRSILCDIDNKYYGALDINSMLRSLMVKGKSAVSNREHAHSVIRGFIHDLSFHNRDIYNNYIDKVRELLDRITLLVPESTFTYDEYYSFRNKDIEWWDFSEEDARIGAAIPVGYPMTPEASGNSIDTLNFSVSSSSQSPGNECNPDRDNTLTENNVLNSYPSTKVLGEVEPRRVHDDCVQSNVFGADEGSSNTNITESGTAVLTSGAHHTTQDMPLVSKPLLSLRQHESRELGRYLERPRRISSYNPANANSVILDPLTTFLATEVIRDKIRWYAYLNAVLHVKVVVVGSPLMAGSQLVALHPWWRRDNGLGSLSFGNARPTIAQMSQLPSIITDLSREKGGEISMPIICPSNGLDITDLEQIKSAFALHIVNLTNTVLPNSASTVVPELAVYVWLTDVSLTGTTMSTELPQSDEYHQCNEDIPSSDHITFKQSVSMAAGKIVGKATELGVSKAMGAMGFSNPNSMDGVAPHVPRVASNMACYNAPVNIDSLAGDYKNEVPLDGRLLGFDEADHMALSNIYTRYTILGTVSFTTGNAITGPIQTYVFPVTPMASEKINRGSYDIYTPTALGVAALPFNRWRGAMTYKFQAIGTAFMKGKIKISHDVKNFTTISEGQKHNTQQLNSIIWDLSTTKEIEVTVPWCSNQPFKTTGNLKEGILLELSNTVSPTIDTNGLLFMCPFTAISESIPSIEVIVSVKGEEGFSFGDMRAVLANYTFAGINNELTTEPQVPQSGDFSDIKPSDIDYTTSDEYFLRLNNGKVILINPEIWSKYLANKYLLEGLDETPQSMIYIENNNTGLLTGEDPNNSFKVNIAGIENDLDDNDVLTMVCMGEKWHSIRQIIKRYTHNWTRSIQNQNLRDSYYRIRLPDRPLVKGWQGTYSLNVQPDGIPVTYARDSFLSFYSVCFLGYRGSLRHKVVVKSSHSATSYADQPMIMVARSTSGYLEERVDINAVSAGLATASISASASSIPRMADARAGAMIGYSHVNPVLEYSTPYYSRGKFCWAQDRFPQLLKATADGGYDVPWHQIIVHGYGNTNGARTRIDKYVAAGDDFSLFFYLYGPQMVLQQPNSWAQS